MIEYLGRQKTDDKQLKYVKCRVTFKSNRRPTHKCRDIFQKYEFL